MLRPLPLALTLSAVGNYCGVLAEPAPGMLHEFLDRHCMECHDKAVKKGGLSFEDISFDLLNEKSQALWVRVHDRVQSGEMPPPKQTRPAWAEQKDFLEPLSELLTTAHLKSRGTVLRRLNRLEYQNTVNDLLGTDLELIKFLPEDGRSGEFDVIGSALGISAVQMQRYMDAATFALDQAITHDPSPPQKTVLRATYVEDRSFQKYVGKYWHHAEDGSVVFFRSSGYPGGLLRALATQTAGRYRVRVKGYAYQSQEPITIEVAAVTGQRGEENSKCWYLTMPPGAPTTLEFEAWLPANHRISIRPWKINRGAFLGKKDLSTFEGQGLAIQWAELEGPFIDEYPKRGHHLLFDGLLRRETANSNARKRQWEVVTMAPSDDVKPILHRFAERAFRRSLQADELEDFHALFEAELAGGEDFEEALRTTAVAILCSPDFLYFREPTGRLDDFALANRLSYFLTRTSPDEKLSADAKEGKLTRQPELLVQHADRLIDSERSAAFVNDFADAWLNLRDIDFTVPDAQLFPEFDAFLRDSMIRETRMFWNELVTQNLGVRHVVKSDFTFLNNVLAEHYQIEGIVGPEMRLVKLPEESLRGGFPSQGAVLKVSANGTNTSPVVRGVWVLERILGIASPPPPPGVPGIEPDIRGAQSLREILEQHREMASCRGCHDKIDPPGFALEEFNPIGGWRTYYRTLGNGEPIHAKQPGGLKVRYRQGLPVDPSGQWVDGSPFSGYAEFREIMAADEEMLAHSLAEKLLTFAIGRELGFSDRTEIERIVAAARPSQYGVRTLMREIITGAVFSIK